MSLSKKLKVVGRTEAGEVVVAGAFRQYETTGLPLDVMFDCFRRMKVVPDWLTFYVEAARAGMKHDRILSMLDTAIADSYGAEFRDVVIERLTLITDRECQTTNTMTAD